MKESLKMGIPRFWKTALEIAKFFNPTIQKKIQISKYCWPFSNKMPCNMKVHVISCMENKHKLSSVQNFSTRPWYASKNLSFYNPVNRWLSIPQLAVDREMVMTEYTTPHWRIPSLFRNIRHFCDCYLWLIAFRDNQQKRKVGNF